MTGKRPDRSFGVTHAFFECEDCGKQFDHYKNAQALAAQHAKKYGHKLNGDVGLSGWYDGRREAPQGKS